MLLAAMLLSVGITACGGATSKSSNTSSRTSSNPASSAGTSATGKDSEDGDSDSASNDDSAIVNYGHAAGSTETQTIAALVKSYYATAVAGNGAKGCSQIYVVFREAIPEDFGQPPGPPSLRGKTCAVVMSKLYRQRHQQLVGENAKLTVTAVRVEGRQGVALLHVGTKAEPRQLQLHTERGVWKIDILLANPLP